MDFLVFALFVLATACAATTGAMFPTGEWYKRLEKGTLELPKGDGAIKLTWQQLVLMIEGIALEQPRTRVRWNAPQITVRC